MRLRFYTTVKFISNPNQPIQLCINVLSLCYRILIENWFTFHVNVCYSINLILEEKQLSIIVPMKTMWRSYKTIVLYNQEANPRLITNTAYELMS